MTTSAERMRAWTGPAILSFGFRPFFLAAGLWATLAMLLWLPMLMGELALPTAFDPVSWHAHEFLFGYLGAVMGGFLLTAVPNWTGRLPVTGLPLAGLAGLWLAGRIAVAVSAMLPPFVAPVIDIAFPVALALFLVREIVAGRNWRNLPVFVLLALFAFANGLFYADAAAGRFAATGLGLRLALAVAVMLISLIGGRIIPSFTRNWLAQRKAKRLPAPFDRFDRIVLIVTGLTLLLWIAAPDLKFNAATMALAGLLQLWRLWRWEGRQTGAEALVWILHAGYLFIGLGFLAQAGATLGWLPAAGAIHLWTVGAIGLMTMAVMTRASLGHSGRALHADRAVTAIYLALIVAAIGRFVASLAPGQMGWLHLVATAWIVAYGGFSVIYWPILTKPKSDRR